MCPLVAAPNRGYADWQRVNNYDSGALWSVDTGVVSGPTASPVLDMSRYANVGGFIRELGSFSTVTFTWYMDAGATVGAGSRTFNITSSINTTCQLRIANLGPFLIVTCSQQAGGNYHFNAMVFGTNRDSPLELFPPSPQLIFVQTANIAAGGTLFTWANSYYAGPVRIWMSTPGTGFWQLFVTQGAAFPIAIETLAPVTSTNITVTTVVPDSGWGIQLSNSGAAAANFNLAVTASMTGAA